MLALAESRESLKTLILNGSPKKNGDTEALVRELASHLSGEVRIISCCNDIRPCNDCRYCWVNIGCSIDDEMQDVYKFLEECSNIVIASPIWFSSISGPLLNIASRIQSVFAASYFQNKKLLLKEKKGVIIIVGAQQETKEIPTQIALGILKYMNVHRPSVTKIYSLDTNNLPAEKDEAALKKCREVAKMLNESCE